MSRRLLISYLSLAVIVLVVLEVPLGVLATRHERGGLADQADRDAATLAVLAQEDLEHPEGHDLSRLASEYRAGTGAEVGVVDAAGTEVVRLDPAERESAGADVSSEVRAALSGRSVRGPRRDEGQPAQVAGVPIRTGGRIVGAVVVSLPAAAVERNVHLVWLGLAVVAALVLCLVTLVGLVLARSVTAPLGGLHAAVRDLGSGELSARARQGGPPEVRDLAAAFNEMAARLEELVDAQRRFVADASHQLRTPLTALRLRIENLRPSPDGAGVAGLDAATSEVLRLSRLVDGLLALSRAEGARGERRAIDVCTVAEHRLESWSALAAERGVSLRLDAPDHQRPRAWMVPGDLEQILDNFLDNALEATPPGGGITIAVCRHDREVELHVRDEGRGMSEDARTHAFDRFWRGDNRPGSGTGLGLAIVEQLVRANEGSIELLRDTSGGLDAAVLLCAASA